MESAGNSRAGAMNTTIKHIVNKRDGFRAARAAKAATRCVLGVADEYRTPILAPKLARIGARRASVRPPVPICPHPWWMESWWTD